LLRANRFDSILFLLLALLCTLYWGFRLLRLCFHFSYVIVVEHDLSVLDYLSDFICCLYGKPGAYGVVTLPFSVREGINIFLSGFVPTENLRFRDESLTFKVF
jgi:translation initiation factor RLI1